MKTIQELEQEFAEKKAALERELDFATQLPVAPKRVLEFKPAPWALYGAKTLAEAIALAKQFPPALGITARRDGCLSVQPDGLHGKYEGKALAWAVDNAYCLEYSCGVGFSSACLSFWTKVGDTVFRVKIDADFNYGAPFPDLPSSSRGYVYRQEGRLGRDEVVKRYPEFSPPAAGGARYGGAESISPLYAFNGLDALKRSVGFAEGA
jgi:hypothetical protein